MKDFVFDTKHVSLFPGSKSKFGAVSFQRSLEKKGREKRKKGLLDGVNIISNKLDSRLRQSASHGTCGTNQKR